MPDQAYKPPERWTTATRISPDPIENDRFELVDDTSGKWVAKLTVADLIAMRDLVFDLASGKAPSHSSPMDTLCYFQDKARALLAQ